MKVMREEEESFCVLQLNELLIVTSPFWLTCSNALQDVLPENEDKRGVFCC